MSTSSSIIALPAPTDDNPNVGTVPSISSSASLYLYTFLATLVLLLAVSGLIIGRSYVIRRRQRLIIEEAIRNGTYIPPVIPNNNNVKKPILHDLYLSTDDTSYAETYPSSIDDTKDDLDWWRGVMPVAAMHKTRGVNTPIPSAYLPLQGGWTPAWLRRHFPEAATSISSMWPRFSSPTPSPPPQLPTSSSLPSLLQRSTSTHNAKEADDALGVTFLIQMPYSHRVEEDVIPPVEFGICRAWVTEPEDKDDAVRVL